MQCQNENCTAEAHVLYLPYCEDCWNEAHSLLPCCPVPPGIPAHTPMLQGARRNKAMMTAISV